MKRLLAPVLLILSCTFASAADAPFTSTLTPEERSAAGVDALTPAQLVQLDALVQRYKAGEVAREVDVAVKVAREEERNEARSKSKDGSGDVWGAPDQIESRIAGTFRGWRGGTIFRLQNGQEWVQSNPETFIPLKPVENPEVRLRSAGFGGYWLFIEGCPKLRVKRVK